MEKIMLNKKNNHLVKDIMLSLDDFPIIESNCLLKEALDKMSNSNLGILCIVSSTYSLKGIMTDGDFRRKLLTVQKPISAFFSEDAIDHSVNNPIVIQESSTLKKAVICMEKNSIWDLPVINKSKKLVGLLHLHHAIKVLLGL